MRIFDYPFRKYYAKAGISKWNRRREKLTWDTVLPDGRTMEQIINGIPARTRTSVVEIHEHNSYVLQHLPLLVNFYAQFRNDRFQNYCGKQVALDRMMREILAMGQVDEPKG